MGFLSPAANMKAVVIGGHSRNIGKTSVMAGLIRALKDFDWTAVKITQYGHGICSLDGKPCGCAPTEHPFVLTEEENPRSRSDTSRFLAAGARRALWLRARQGQLAEALPLLHQALRNDCWVMIESNSILQFLEPALYLAVLDSSCRDFKSSALNFLHRANALVPIESRLDPQAWPALDPQTLDRKLIFPVPARGYFSPELCSFVRARLSSSPVVTHPRSLTGSAGDQEQPWRR